jgi:hypothetical protein
MVCVKNFKGSLREGEGSDKGNFKVSFMERSVFNGGKFPGPSHEGVSDWEEMWDLEKFHTFLHRGGL